MLLAVDALFSRPRTKNYQGGSFAGDALRVFIQSGRLDMSAVVKSEMITRRKVVSLMGLAAAFGFAGSYGIGSI